MDGIRVAGPDDVPAIWALVEGAYEHYVPRIGTRPAPMDDDHAAHVRRGDQYVLVLDGAVTGAVVVTTHADHVFVDNLAVDPSLQGRGLGRTLLEFAEGRARDAGVAELRLYTNAAMTENLAMYAHLGYAEAGREQVGPFHRVRLVKRLTG